MGRQPAPIGHQIFEAFGTAKAMPRYESSLFYSIPQAPLIFSELEILDVATTVLAATKIVPDERQREAIEHVHGPMLVIAGAGTGKTTVLTQRVAHLIREGHARPDEILALTYTDNSAAEMLSRVRNELEGNSSTINVDGLAGLHFSCLVQRASAAARVWVWRA